MRRRTGGDDEGWHLKIPVGSGRDEIRVPLSCARITPPVALRRLVLARTLGEPLEQVALIATTRTTYDLLDDQGRPLAEIVDDQVAGPSGSPEAPPTLWREWEVELDEGDEELLARVTTWLAGRSVEASVIQRKVERVLGPRLHAPEPSPLPGRKKPAGRLLQHRLEEQIEPATQPAKHVMPGLLDHEAKRLRRRMAVVDRVGRESDQATTLLFMRHGMQRVRPPNASGTPPSRPSRSSEEMRPPW